MNARANIAGAAQSHRLETGGVIDRSKPISFRFDGKSYGGFEGDTLASALIANGVRLVGRSFKYHRPRGILSAGAEEPNALVELREGARREPNTRATQIELYEGLVAASQNRWPSLAFDLMAINGVASPLLGAGFYYKTFMWPASFWEKVYEPLIRRAAGLGRAAGVEDPDIYEKASLHCDVLVIGSGPAGLLAALTAGRAGALVVLAEQDFRLGGRLLDEDFEIDGAESAQWLRSTEAELESLPDVRILRRTTIFGAYDQRNFGAVERVADHLPVPPEHAPRQRLWRITAQQTVLASGSIERPLVFGDNDRPGIMLAGAVRAYLNRFAARPGKVAVVFASNDDAARTVGDLAAAGITIAAMVDPRPQSSAAMSDVTKSAGVPLLTGSVVARAVGGHSVRAAEINGPAGQQTISCDLIAMSGGWNPTLHLTSHLGHNPLWNEQIAAFVPDRLPEGMRVAGAARGSFTLAATFADGAAAGAAAAGDAGFATKISILPQVATEPAAMTPLWRVRGAQGKCFIDFQNDVTDKDLEVAEREGFRAAELMKRYTTLGMATDQGKTGNVNGLAVMAEITGSDIGKIGTTTFRPPFTPVAMGALAGHSRGKHFRPTRLAPSHDWANQQGAVFVEAGAWLRAQYFPEPGDDWLAATLREVKAVRELVGFCDVSTLGKIDLQGPDSGVFLDRLYCNTMSSLAVGKVRYGLMLREDGLVFDDGTVARLRDRRWLITTTTANAARVMQHMDYCAQLLWPELDVQFVSVTEQWAQVSVAGPRARHVMRKLVDPEFDISNVAFPYMAAADVTVCGRVKARLFRISFSGELAYEIAVPARYGDALMWALAVAGAEYGIAPYGTEALSILRIEKGHAAGGELNGQTTARDLGLGKMMSTKKDYLGRALAQRPAFLEVERPGLVGFKPVDRTQKLAAGAHFVAPRAQPVTANDLGHMTSVAAWSSLGHSLGLGLLAGGATRIGTVVIAHDPVRGRDVPVEVCHPVFYDPAGERLRG
jgi:heterotetrameric sarcosine oxidase alpha subunit